MPHLPARVCREAVPDPPEGHEWLYADEVVRARGHKAKKLLEMKRVAGAPSCTACQEASLYVHGMAKQKHAPLCNDPQAKPSRSRAVARSAFSSALAGGP